MCRDRTGPYGRPAGAGPAKGDSVARRLASVRVALALAVGVVGGVGPSASAPVGAAGVPGLGLPLTLARDLVVDDGTGRIFVSGDDAVVARAPDGTAVGKIAGIPQAWDLLAVDGAVYALSFRDGKVLRIDPATLAVTKTYALPAPQGRFLATYAGKVWTVVPGRPTDALAAIDPATGAVTTFPGLDGYDTVALVGTPSGLAVVQGDGVALFTLSGSTLVAGATYAVSPVSDSIITATLSPDGSRLLVDDQSESYLHGVLELALPGLVPGVVHVTGQQVGGIATTSAGGGLVGTAGSSSPTYDVAGYRPETFVFRPDGTAPVAQVQTDRGDGRGVLVGGVEFSADGTVLWTLRDDAGGVSPIQPVVVPVPLRPAQAVAFPRVVAPSGASTGVTGTGLAGGTVSAGGLAAPVTRSRPTELTVALPDLAPGTRSVVVTGLTGATSSTSVVVRDLGPFTSSVDLYDHVDEAFHPAPGAIDLAAAAREESRLLTGGSIGALAVDFSRDANWRRDKDLVARLYLAAFGRLPEPEGLRYWWGQRGTMTLGQIASFFARSTELRETYGSLDDAAFVAQVYENVLGRAPDAGGAAYWEGRLAGGLSRGGLLAHFSESAEHRRRSAPAVVLELLTVPLLGRAATLAEAAAAGGRLAGGGTEVAEAERILRSAEYATRTA